MTQRRTGYERYGGGELVASVSQRQVPPLPLLKNASVKTTADAPVPLVPVVYYIRPS